MASWSGAAGSKAVPIRGARASSWSRPTDRFSSVGFRADRLGDVGETVQGQQAPELAVDPPGQPGPFIDQGGVDLDEAGAGADPVEGVDAILDAADRDQGPRPAGGAAKR